MVLDDFVLDVKRFMGEHPGGRFSLEHNIGRDVSKFFHGGYSLENVDKVPEHTHSNDARKVVNSLIIGRLEGSVHKRLMQVKSSQRNANGAGNVKTFEFVEAPQAAVAESEGNDYKRLIPNPPCSLVDIRYIGRHYLVKSLSHSSTREFDRIKNGIKRHYTEAFCMRPSVYLGILDLAKDHLSGSNS